MPVCGPRRVISFLVMQSDKFKGEKGGYRWALIAAQISGRTDDDCSNRARTIMYAPASLRIAYLFCTLRIVRALSSFSDALQ